nr:DCC1-like thiol-disulfide oxidoreductase family protein [Variovorax sp. PAMC 28711]
MYRRQTGADRCAWIDAATCPESDFGPGLSRNLALARIHVRRRDGVLVDGTRGFALLWRTLPRFAWAGRLASAGPFPVLLEAAYQLFLRVRPLWRRQRPPVDVSPGHRHPASRRLAPPVRGEPAGSQVQD